MEPIRLTAAVINRRKLLGLSALALAASALPASAASDPRHELLSWYRLVLELVRHTPTYSPPVASRTLAYLGVTAYQAVASCDPKMTTLAEQLTGLSPLPAPDESPHGCSVILNAALTRVVAHFFANTGPAGQRAMAAAARALAKTAQTGVTQDVAARSTALGLAIGNHVIQWSQGDGGAEVKNMGFPLAYTLTPGPEHWVPTSLIAQQQTPLLPDWGLNRPFAMPVGACRLPPPLTYSEVEGSDFFAEAQEVVAVSKSLTTEQDAIARFWSDDAMLSSTPPGHWISIAITVLKRDDLDLARSVDALARLGIGLADAFIACWAAKYEHDLVRPVTYIRRVIDKDWTPTLITPPFPEYPSGHSTQSAAAAEVLTALFGDGVAFIDDTHSDDGLGVRHFASFRAAAEEAAVSRLYGGIHFRAAIERGMAQGRCTAAHTNALRTL